MLSRMNKLFIDGTVSNKRRAFNLWKAAMLHTRVVKRFCILAKRTFYGSKASAFDQWRNYKPSKDYTFIKNMSDIEDKLEKITNRR